MSQWINATETNRYRDLIEVVGDADTEPDETGRLDDEGLVESLLFVRPLRPDLTREDDLKCLLLSVGLDQVGG